MKTLRQVLTAFAALATLQGATLPAGADWQPVERIEHYPVSGTTGIELYSSIGENGPQVGIGRAIAYTDFELLWSRDYVPGDGTCTLASARPSLVITYKLPKPSAPLPPAMQALWDRFIDGVTAHEKVHGEIIIDMTRQIEAASVGLTAPSGPDCNGVREVLQGHLARISAERQRRNVEFDRDELSEGGNVHQLILALVNGG
jgi:predicted secreted Zn-dependent protease